MEDKTLMQKLYDIARATRTTNEYISYIESVVQGDSFSARDLANKIYKSAMIKYEASIREHASAIDANCDLMADQMDSVKAFAIRYGLLRDYAFYLERIVLRLETFDMQDALNRLTEAAICTYDMRLRSKIDASTGIALNGGYQDAVQRATLRTL